jgi:hypothetical protein
VRLAADRPGALSFDLSLDRPERFATIAAGIDGLQMTGQLNNGIDGKGVKYAARLRALPVGGKIATSGGTSTGSAWLCMHLWDHYLFTGDRAFLADAYPILRGSARFYADMLVEEPAHHWLVTVPSNSPENAFLLPDGARAHICLGATVDMQLFAC